MTSRDNQNVIAAATDALALPTPDELIPMPADIFRDIGFPTPKEVVKKIRSEVESKAAGFRGRF